MQKLIVGCGYLGLRVAKSWMAEGHTVSALTRSADRAAELSHLGIRPIVGDICEPATLAALPDADTLLFAVGYDRTSGRSQQSVYVDGLSNVLQSVAGRIGRLIYISSSSVYGQTDGEWVDEFSECQPTQPGGACCLGAEKLVHSVFDSNSATNSVGDHCANVLRLSGIYGPGRLLSRVESLRRGEAIAGRPDAWLNLIHVDDAVSAVLACEERGQPDQTYLVSDNQPIRRADYYGLLAELADAPSPGFNPETAANRGSGGINKRCRNRRILDELKVLLRYPTISAGLPHSLGESGAPWSVPVAVPRE